jgi:hypothetical protein
LIDRHTYRILKGTWFGSIFLTQGEGQRLTWRQRSIAKEVKPSPTPHWLVPVNSVELDRSLELSQDSILSITAKAHLAKKTIGVASKFQFRQTCASQFFSIDIREEDYIDKQGNVPSTWGTAIDN